MPKLSIDASQEPEHYKVDTHATGEDNPLDTSMKESSQAKKVLDDSIGSSTLSGIRNFRSRQSKFSDEGCTTITEKMKLEYGLDKEKLCNRYQGLLQGIGSISTNHERRANFQPTPPEKPNIQRGKDFIELNKQFLKKNSKNTKLESLNHSLERDKVNGMITFGGDRTQPKPALPKDKDNKAPNFNFRKNLLTPQKEPHKETSLLSNKAHLVYQVRPTNLTYKPVRTNSKASAAEKDGYNQPKIKEIFSQSRIPPLKEIQKVTLEST